MDLIVIGQAIHWFTPSLAHLEFRRILKPRGWLAVLWNHPTDQPKGEILRDICSAENGWAIADPDKQPQPVDLNYYYGNQYYTRYEYLVTQTQSWDQFFGALCSDSHAPDDTHPRFWQFRAAARRVFLKYSTTDQFVSTYATTLNIGRIL
jgi:hypothetical protein